MQNDLLSYDGDIYSIHTQCLVQSRRCRVGGGGGNCGATLSMNCRRTVVPLARINGMLVSIQDQIKEV